jgi:hypothetical protein
MESLPILFRGELFTPELFSLMQIQNLCNPSNVYLSPHEPEGMLISAKTADSGGRSEPLGQGVTPCARRFASMVPTQLFV